MHTQTSIISAHTGSPDLSSRTADERLSALPTWVYAPPAPQSKQPASALSAGAALLTVPEVAAELRLSVKTIQRHIRNGLLPAVRIGRAVRITRQDLASLREVPNPANRANPLTCRE